MPGFDDTIAAIATASGAAGLAVVRVSGPQAVAIADAVFRGSAALADGAGNTLHHGWAAHPIVSERRIDEVVVALFRAPHSYTREDVVEISCHGGSIPAQRVLEALLGAGARLARPGEFTLRAFLNGRIDLAQAEAVADLIHAETAAAHELALSQLAGELSRRLEAVSERVTDALAEVEARVDFAEDVGGVEVPPHVVAAIAEAERSLAALLEGAPWARAVREGLWVPIVGRPNVGKSSLFNALLGEERAIVTDVPGTTRDRVSEAIEVAGVRVTLSDTAGLRQSAEPIEAIGIARAREALESCTVALWVVDGAEPLASEDRWIAERLRTKRVLVALNKRDLPAVTQGAEVTALLDGAADGLAMARSEASGEANARTAVLDAAPAVMAREVERVRVVAVSAARHEGLEELRAALASLLGADGTGGHAAAVGNARHAEALGRARDALVRASAIAARGEPGEIVALELRECLGAIGEVTGRSAGEDLLDRIFSRFCIGK
jgi:tRNA modification GTPase